MLKTLNLNIIKFNISVVKKIGGKKIYMIATYHSYSKSPDNLKIMEFEILKNSKYVSK